MPQEVEPITFDQFCCADADEMWINRMAVPGMICLTYETFTLTMVNGGQCYMIGVANRAMLNRINTVVEREA